MYILGNPLWVIAFGSKALDVYRIMDYMTEGKWSLNGLHRPPCVHICVTLRHTLPGIAERFVKDLKSAVESVRRNPHEKGGMASVYGMAAAVTGGKEADHRAMEINRLDTQGPFPYTALCRQRN